MAKLNHWTRVLIDCVWGGEWWRVNCLYSVCEGSVFCLELCVCSLRCGGGTRGRVWEAPTGQGGWGWGGPALTPQARLPGIPGQTVWTRAETMWQPDTDLSPAEPEKNKGGDSLIHINKFRLENLTAWTSRQRTKDFYLTTFKVLQVSGSILLYKNYFAEQ